MNKRKVFLKMKPHRLDSKAQLEAKAFRGSQLQAPAGFYLLLAIGMGH